MSRIDSIYAKTKKYRPLSVPPPPIRRTAKPSPVFYYFYRSLQIILIMWILLLIGVIVSPWTNYYINKNLISESESAVLGTNDSTSEVLDSYIPPKPVETFQVPTFLLEKGDLKISAPIVEGIDQLALIKGIGHHKDSVWPNEKGNVVLSGHSFDLNIDNRYGQVFGRLREVALGDLVEIAYQNKKYTYKVFKKETVGAKDTTYFGKEDKWVLTFYTCDPPKTDWKRLVFQAELIKIE